MAKAENVDETPDVSALDSSWVFIDRPATVDEVKALLSGLDVPYSAVGGEAAITMDRYLPYVLPMSNNMKVKVPDPKRSDRTVEEYHLQTTLYTQVAGRLAMLNDVAELNGWTVDIYPEPVTPTGLPGYLRFDNEKLLFRVYVEISVDRADGSRRTIGRKFGTAGGKATGGFNAEGSNPNETVETSALGRALAQWGFGILPGSGIASVEEMRLARQNSAPDFSRRRGAGEPPAEKAKEERGDLVASAIEFSERRRKMSGKTQGEADDALGLWVSEKFSIDGFVTPSGGYEWPLLTDKQIEFLRNSLRDAVVKATAAGEE